MRNEIQFEEHEKYTRESRKQGQVSSKMADGYFGLIADKRNMRTIEHSHEVFNAMRTLALLRV